MKNEFELTIKYFDKRAIATRRELWNKIADLQSQLQQANEIINNPDTLIFQQQELIDNLQSQLAKKETLLKKYVATSCPIKQDKISFAIEQLEKVKEWCENHKFSDEYDYVIAYEEDEEDASGCEDYFKDYIDNQIKQLKEKNNG